jgi:copper chaperone
MDETNTIRVKQPPENRERGMNTIVTKQIAIEGMTCDGCVRTVDKALRGQRGVKEVRVDRNSAMATVTYDSGETDIPELHDTLLKAGYRPTRLATEP